MSRQADLNLALKAAQRAAAVIRQRFSRRLTIEEKHNAGIVTEADKAAETEIISILSGGSPHAILGEESGGLEGQTELRWVVDPLDGTTNFSRGFPLFAVSIALMRGWDVELGVVLDVCANRCYSAVAGLGAFVDGTPLCPREPVGKGAPLIFINSGYCEEDEKRAALLHYRLSGRYAIRKFGSTALELCAVAAGQADAFMSTGDEIWDFAAGICLVRESGGAVLDWRGGEWSGRSSFLLAGRPESLTDIVSDTGALSEPLESSAPGKLVESLAGPAV